MAFSQYFSLGESDWAKQRVIALDFWTEDTPTYEEDTVADGYSESFHVWSAFLRRKSIGFAGRGNAFGQKN
jgi:hypothetical protein